MKIKPRVYTLQIGLIAILLLTPCLTAVGQIYEEWSTNVGGDDTEHFYSAQETSDGGFILVGFVEDYSSDDRQVYLVKTDSMGEPTWEKLYGDIKNDEGYSVTLTSNGYVIAGVTKSYGSGLNDIWLISTNEQGEVQWDKVLGGAKDDIAYSILSLNTGELIIAGSTA